MKRLLVIALILFPVIAFATGRETITVTSGAVVGFADITCRANSCTCVVKNKGAEVWVDWIGSTPSTDNGVPMASNDILTLSNDEYNSLQAIATSSTSTLYGMCR